MFVAKFGLTQQSEKCIQMSKNKPVFGLEVLETAVEKIFPIPKCCALKP